MCRRSWPPARSPDRAEGPESDRPTVTPWPAQAAPRAAEARRGPRSLRRGDSRAPAEHVVLATSADRPSDRQVEQRLRRMSPGGMDSVVVGPLVRRNEQWLHIRTRGRGRSAERR